MTNQIIVLNSSTESDSSFFVTGVFWLTGNPNNIIPIPNFTSQVPFIDSANLALLQSGALVEQSFNTGAFPSGTTLATVQTYIQSLFTTAQTNLGLINPPLSNLVGSVYNGSSWVSPSPFTPYSINVSSGSLSALNSTVQVAITTAQSVGVQVAVGTFIGTIIAETSFDGGTNWNQTIFVFAGNTTLFAKSFSITYTTSPNFAQAGTIVVNGGSGLVRVRVFAYTSGSCNVTLRSTGIFDESIQLFTAGPGLPVPPQLAITGGSVTTAAPTYATGTANAMSLNAAGGLRVDGSGVTQPVSGTVTANQGVAVWTDNITQIGGVAVAAVAKGTQAANALGVQDLKDSGRVIKTYVATAVAGATSEALLTLTPYAALVAGATGTSFAITAGKTLRLQFMVVTWRNNTAAAGGVTIRFRTNANGPAIVSSPVQFAMNATTSLATIGSGMTSTFIFPDGFEMSGTQQFCVTQLAVTAVVGLEFSICAFEY